MIALVLSVLAQFPMDVFEVTGPFKQLEKKDGVIVSQREVKGSPYFEYRVEATSQNTAEQLCTTVFEWGTREGGAPGVTAHKMIEDGEDVRVVYRQISQPVVANRDFALTVARQRLDGGGCRIRFRTSNEKAPRLPDGFVRMNKLWGEWLVEPLAEGGAKLTHTMFSDPAGSVPPFLVHGVQRSSTRESAMTALARTRASAQKGAAR